MPVTTIHESGRQIRALREKLRLKYRDVVEASQRIAKARSNREFAIGLSRLADIENKGTVPSIYRLYSLSVIYGTNFDGLLGLYGVNITELVADSARLGLPQTRMAGFDVSSRVRVEIPPNLEDRIDMRNTAYVSRLVHQWGKLPAVLLQSLDLRKQKYAFIGTEDLSMHPLIRPGSFVQIDETKRTIREDGWTHEFEKPIYFLEHRQGFRCGWCSKKKGMLIVQSHPASFVSPEIYVYPGEVDVLGQVVGVAMRLDREKRRRTRYEAGRV